MISRDLYLAKRMFYFALRMRVRKWKIITSGCFSVFRMWRQSFLEIRILLSMSLVLYWSQPINNQCCVWISACGSYYDCKMPFSYNHQGALKKKNRGLLLTRPGNYTWTWGHTVWLWAEGECLGLGSAFIGVKDGGLGFLRLTLFVNLKHKE